MDTLFTIVLYILYGFFGFLLLLFVLAFKAKFKLRHDSLEVGQRVQVYLDELLVMEGTVDSAGRIYLKQEAVVSEATEASAGQVCRVVYGGLERFAEPIRPD